MEDTYIFRKSVRSTFSIKILDKHLPYKALNTRLKKVGKLIGFLLLVGAYYFRRGNGEALDNSSKFHPVQPAILTEILTCFMIR